LPAGIPKLVYNSVLSWAGGWYFLIAAEIIAVGPVRRSSPGLGSFLVQATALGDIRATAAGLGTLVAIIVFLNVFVWRPLSEWAANFKYEYGAAGGGETEESLIYSLWKHSPVVRAVRAMVGGLWRALDGRRAGAGRGAGAGARGGGGVLDPRRVWRRAGTVFIAFGLAMVLLALQRTAAAVAELFAAPLAPEARLIPLGTLLSFLRLAAAYLTSLAWTVPVALWVGQDDQAFRLLSPVFEVAASVPATALFPIIVLFVVTRTGSMDLAAILLVLTGMQWYLLFNLISGVRSIPADLDEAMRAYRVSGRLYRRRVLLPAILPSLITGSITAWGGGWNALIVSEFIVYAGRQYQTLGIGSLLDRATYQTGNFQVIWLSLATMVTVIVVLNRLVWRRLYAIAATRYRMEV